MFLQPLVLGFPALRFNATRFLPCAKKINFEFRLRGKQINIKFLIKSQLIEYNSHPAMQKNISISNKHVSQTLGLRLGLGFRFRRGLSLAREDLLCLLDDLLKTKKKRTEYSTKKKNELNIQHISHEKSIKFVNILKF